MPQTTASSKVYFVFQVAIPCRENSAGEVSRAHSALFNRLAIKRSWRVLKGAAVRELSEEELR